MMLEPAGEVEGEIQEETQVVEDQLELPVEEDAPAKEAESFTDVSYENLSPEMQAIYKRMEAGLQQKFQGLAKEKKDLAAKAEVLDKVLTDPAYRQSFLQSIGALDKKPEAEEDNWKPMKINPHDGFDLASKFDADTIKGMEAAAASVIEKYLLPKLRPYEQAMLMLMQDRAEGGWKEVASKVPGADKHRAAVEQIRRANPNLSYEQALYAVAGRELFQAQGTKKPTPAQAPAKKVSLTKGSAAPASRARLFEPKNSELLGIVRDILGENGQLPS